MELADSFKFIGNQPLSNRGGEKPTTSNKTIESIQFNFRGWNPIHSIGDDLFFYWGCWGLMKTSRGLQESFQPELLIQESRFPTQALGVKMASFRDLGSINKGLFWPLNPTCWILGSQFPVKVAWGLDGEPSIRIGAIEKGASDGARGSDYSGPTLLLLPSNSRGYSFHSNFTVGGSYCPTFHPTTIEGCFFGPSN